MDILGPFLRGIPLSGISSLDLSTSSVSAHHLRVISSATNLRSLDLSKVSTLSAAALQHLSSASQILCILILL
jgi:hypothetical protein